MAYLLHAILLKKIVSFLLTQRGHCVRQKVVEEEEEEEEKN